VPNADDQLLNHVTTQLDEVSVEEFCERWGVSTSSPAPDGPGTVTT